MTAKSIVSLVTKLKETPLPNPCICGVYFLLSKCQVVYVGASEDIEQRIRSHWKTTDKEDGKYFDEVRYIEMANMSDAESLEWILIQTLMPRLNKQVRKDGGKV